MNSYVVRYEKTERNFINDKPTKVYGVVNVEAKSKFRARVIAIFLIPRGARIINVDFINTL